MVTSMRLKSQALILRKPTLGSEIAKFWRAIEHPFLHVQRFVPALFLLQRAFGMPLLDFADIFLQFPIELGRVCFESGVVRPQKKFDPTLVFRLFPRNSWCRIILELSCIRL